MDINFLKEKQLAFDITMCCTLNCKHCALMTPRFKQVGLARHTPFDQIKKEYDSVFQIYDFIEDVTISGGEPLTHPNITDIVSYSMKFESQFDHLRIFSNGTIVPPKKLMEQFKCYSKLSLVVDDYGPKVSTKVADIKKLFESENLPLRINIYYDKRGG